MKDQSSTVKHPVLLAVLLVGCAPRARFVEEERLVFVKNVTRAVTACAHHGTPATCPEADRLAAAYYSKKSP